MADDDTESVTVQAQFEGFAVLESDDGDLKILARSPGYSDVLIAVNIPAGLDTVLLRRLTIRTEGEPDA